MKISGIFPECSGVQKTYPLCFSLAPGAVINTLAAIVCIAAMVFWFSCGKAPEQRFVASFDGRKVTAEELRSYMKPLIYVLQDRPYYEKYEDSKARRQALEYLVVENILAERARKQGLQQSERFHRLLAQQRKGLARQYVYQTEVVEKSKVSEREAEQYYRDHEKEFVNPDTVVYQRIFFHILPDSSQAEREKTLATAHSVLDQLAEDKQFQDMMKQYSTDPPKYQTARYLVRGDDSVSTPVVQMLFGLQATQISDVIETPMGYGIYQVKERYAGQQIPFQAAQRKIAYILQQRARQDALKDFAHKAETRFSAVAQFRTLTSWPEKSAVLFQIESKRVTLADVEKEIAARFSGQQPNWQQVQAYLDALYVSRLLDRAADDIDLHTVPELERNISFYENYLLSELWLDDQVTSHIISHEEQLRYYEAHPEYFRTKARRECRMISCYAHIGSDATLDERIYALKLAEEKIQRAYEELLQGADFAHVARRYSEDKFALAGGYIGYVTEPSSALFDINIKKLAIGEFSKPIALPNGFMIIELEALIPRQVKPFEEIQGALLERMQIEYRRSLYASVRQEILDTCNLTLLNAKDESN